VFRRRRQGEIAVGRRVRRRSEASPPGGKNIESDQCTAIVALRKDQVNESAPGDNRWRDKRLEMLKAQCALAHKRGRGRKYPLHTSRAARR
jgi:hypothetical protein